MKTLALSLISYPLVSGFPHLRSLGDGAFLNHLQARQDSLSEGNCGPVPCTTFDEAEQFVSVSGEYEFVAPSKTDLRGPCPGLNAAANHGYLPHSGVATIQQTIDGLGAAYGMSPDLALFLAAYAVVIDGDIGSLSWSIGGPFPPTLINGVLGGDPQGISYSHNNYEGDSSATRADAYLNNGDASTMIVSKFQQLYDTAVNDRYTLDGFRGQYARTQQESIATNPYLFYAPFSALVVPAAYNFVLNFMSNHSAEEPNGYLDGNQLKQFFSVTGESGNFQYTPGYERIPEEWYRRPSSNQYSLVSVVADLAIGFVRDPSTIKFGGNTGTPNSFVGVDVGDLTGGVYNADTLLEGNNLGCFFLQAAQAGLPDILNGVLSDLAPALDLLNSAVSPVLADLACPQLEQYNQGLFNQFPGAKYHPTP
ncbi:hypothetical protein GTA08_BOTSDO05233 [Neofusicoccum parvum]|uniref:Uncharacterized protein n=1 Tax=Neofusicoccum parvum TaxID=310453 RepID=A0ACB5SCZ5_9PEZI|nr:hypothetical protein GTA08_BOTSDO05233 [Neofusicoccum parvum]